jgi:two-component system, OmpR family, sensor histidine kinase CreC
MYLGIRMFFAVCAMLGLAAFFVFYNFRAEIRPSVHDVMEEVMIDSAYLMAELAAEPLQKNTLTTGDFAQQMANYRARKIDANIWGMSKETLDFRVLVIDTKGVVQFDSEKRDRGVSTAREHRVTTNTMHRRRRSTHRHRSCATARPSACYRSRNQPTP